MPAAGIPTRLRLATRAEGLVGVVAAVALAIVVVLAASDGGFEPTAWYPATLLLLVLLVVAMALLPRTGRVPRAVLAAAFLLSAYAALSYLSIIWADQPGDAWDGANRAALFAIVFTLFSLWPVRRWAAGLLGAFALSIVVIGLVELLRAAGADEPASYFITGRFAEPVGYPNANVALWTCALWPCVILAARRQVPPPVRGLFLGGALVLAALALMGQSRGWLFALPPAAIVFVAIAPQRIRALLALVGLGCGVLVVRGPVLEVYDTVSRGGAIAPPLAQATRTIVFTAVVLVLVGTVAGYLDRALRIPPRGGRRAPALLVAGALALAATGGLWVGSGSDPATLVREKWDQFTSTSTPTKGSTRFSGQLGSQRYDFWRVAWSSFRAHPVVGVGADNFQQDYLERRHGNEEPRYPHSLELRVLSQTGLVGALLLFGGIAAAGFAASRAIRGPPDAVATTAAGAAMVFLYWLIHGSVDWFYEFAGFGAAAFAMLGMAAGLAGPRPPDPRYSKPAVPLARGLVRGGVLAGCVLVLGMSLVAPWLSARQADEAARVWPVRPGEAFDRLGRAARLNPLAAEPNLLAGAIALRMGRLGRAEHEFRAALKRSDREAYAVLELGAIASQRGDHARALVLLQRASRLDPRDEVTADALRRVRSGRRLDVEQLRRAILDSSVQLDR